MRSKAAALAVTWRALPSHQAASGPMCTLVPPWSLQARLGSGSIHLQLLARLCQLGQCCSLCNNLPACLPGSPPCHQQSPNHGRCVCASAACAAQPARCNPLLPRQHRVRRVQGVGVLVAIRARRPGRRDAFVVGWDGLGVGWGWIPGCSNTHTRHASKWLPSRAAPRAKNPLLLALQTAHQNTSARPCTGNTLTPCPPGPSATRGGRSAAGRLTPWVTAREKLRCMQCMCVCVCMRVVWVRWGCARLRGDYASVALRG